MEEEFKMLLEIFAEPQEEKERKLGEILKLFTEFFARYKHILASGTEAEKKAIQKKINLLREHLHKENEKTRAKMGLTPTEIKEIAAHPEHFTKEQWAFLQKARNSLEEEAKTKEKQESLKRTEKKSSKTSSKKSGWMRT